MPLFLIQFSYSSRATKSLVEKPDDDNASEAEAMVASVGAKLLGYWFAFGKFDGVTLIDAPNNHVAAAVALAVGGGGHVTRVETTVLMTMEEARAARRTAATATHVPPNENGESR